MFGHISIHVGVDSWLNSWTFPIPPHYVDMIWHVRRLYLDLACRLPSRSSWENYKASLCLLRLCAHQTVREGYIQDGEGVPHRLTAVTKI